MPSYTELFLSMIALMLFNEGFMEWRAWKKRHNDRQMPIKTNNNKNSRREINAVKC